MKTILVIDDSPLILETVSMILEQERFNVVLVQEPERALGLCNEINFDAVLCDLCMGGLDSASPGNSLTAGMDIIWKIMDRYPKVPIIAMSGKLEKPDLYKMKKLGLAGAIQKPFGRDTLVEELKALVS